MLSAPIIVAGLAVLAILLIFMALWILFQQRDPIVERLDEYGLSAHRLAGASTSDVVRRYGVRGMRGLFFLFGMGPRLALTLTQADVPLTATEFSFIVIALVASGFGLGTWRYSPILGIALAIPLGIIPFIVVRVRQRKRLRLFTQQLPDTLTLLVGALRAGHGLNQAFDLVVKHLPPPMSTEIAKVVRAVSLGIPLTRALDDAVARIGSEDFNLLVVAINVQSETGGNLAETLDIISDTIRDRLRMLNEIRVLTSQQRFTGYVLALLPAVTGLAVFFINPEYISDLFAPGWVRILPISAVVMQVLGFLVIRKIVDIEV
jgi:tight adherence protein B